MDFVSNTTFHYSAYRCKIHGDLETTPVFILPLNILCKDQIVVCILSHLHDKLERVNMTSCEEDPSGLERHRCTLVFCQENFTLKKGLFCTDKKQKLMHYKVLCLDMCGYS